MRFDAHGSWLSSAQTRPAALTSLTPYGIQRGTTATFTADGANLMGADPVIFTDPGLSAEIVKYEDLGADIRVRQTGETGAIIQDRAQKGRLTLTITAAAGVPLGRHGFRVRTPLGTTSFIALWVGEDPETSEQEPNDQAADATAVQRADHRQRLARRARGRGRVSRARAGRRGSGGQDHRHADRVQRRHAW